MSTALLQQTCRDYVRLLGSFLDGELDPPGMLEVESHVAHCAACREHVELLRASRASLQRTVRRNAPDALRNRIEVAMTAEAARGEVRDAERQAERDSDGEGEGEGERKMHPSAGRFLGWRTMVPLASAAALALFWGAASRGPANHNREQTAGIGDDLLAELVAEHSQPLPPETTDPKAVRGLEKYVGVPVHPGSFEKGGAKLVGGRVLPMRQVRAAMLQYVIVNANGDEPRRVSVIVYDPSKIQVNSSDLAPRAVGTARVQVGQQKGYSVAVTQRGGVGYAFASDMDAERSAQFAAHVYDE